MKAQYVYPTMPVFNSIEEERKHRKERLAGAFRIFSKCGFDNGIAGHITVRDPEYPDLFWVNQFGMHFSQVTVSNLILIDGEGNVKEGEGVANAAGIVIHSEVHKARPDVIACAHTHSTYGMAWSALGRLLDPINQDSCAFYNDHAVFGKFNGVVNDYNEGKKLGETLANNKALILENHGLLTVGETVDEAAWWFIMMERCCQAQILAESAGTPKLIDPDVAEETSKFVGASKNGWFNFQTLWPRILKEQPDFLE